MKVIRKNIAIITALCMVFTLSMPINSKAASVSDISDHWANTTIQSWIENDLISGYPDGSFKPDNNITRAEFMTLVNKAFGFTSQAAISFPDVTDDAWYFPAVKEALAAGYISGYPDGTMRPDNPITREEVASIISKIKMLKDNEEAANDFSDAMLMTWSKGAIGAIAEANIMNGYPGGSFIPQNYIKRGEAVVSLDKASKYINLPPAPSVIGDDEKDTVTGLTSMMEYKLDSLDWVTYDATTFNKLSFSGNHTLLVRFLATDSMPFSQTTTLIFTAGVPLAGSRSGGSSGVIVPVADKVISFTTIQGVMAPATGADPDLEIEETDQYKGTVTWTPTTSAFAAEITYTAIITLEAKAGFTLTGVGQNAFMVPGAVSTTNSSDEGNITAIFPATAPIEITITTTTIQGVTAPVTGDVPDLEIIETDQYTGTLTWEPEDATFVAGTTYTAIINLTPRLGYTFAGVGENAFTVDGAITTNASGSGDARAVFPATEYIPITEVTITGVAEVGTVLNAVVSPVGATVNYQWQRAASIAGIYTNIVGATGSTITVETEYLNEYLRVIVTGTGNYTGEVQSQPKAMITVIFSRAVVDPDSTYFSADEVNNIFRVLWGELPEDTIPGMDLESGLFSTSGDALVIDADKITLDLLDWLHHDVMTDGLIALKITASNGQEFLESNLNEDNGNIENTPGSTALRMVLVPPYDDWLDTTIRVDLDDLESLTNSGTLLMIDGSTRADFQVITIGDLTPVGAINITSSSLTISGDNDTLQFNAEVSPINAYDKSVRWVIDDGTPVVEAGMTDTDEIARISNALDHGNVYALKNGTVTVTAISNDTGMVSNPLVVTITGQVGPPTPSGIVITHESSYGANDGMLSGVAPGQEYQLIGAVSWTAITGTTVTGLAPGSYTVRVAETPTAPAGFETASLVIMPGLVAPAETELLLQLEMESQSEPLKQFEPEQLTQLEPEPEPQLKPKSVSKLKPNQITDLELEPEPDTTL